MLGYAEHYVVHSEASVPLYTVVHVKSPVSSVNTQLS